LLCKDVNHALLKFHLATEREVEQVLLGPGSACNTVGDLLSEGQKALVLDHPVRIAKVADEIDDEAV